MKCQRNLIPIKIKRHHLSLYQRYRSRISPQFINQWTRQLATLLNAHIPLSQSLAISAKSTQSHHQRHFILSIQHHLQQGFSFSESLQHTHSHHFDSVYLAIVKAGEVSGKLAQALNNLINYREHKALLQKRIKNALIYPTVIASRKRRYLGRYFALPWCKIASQNATTIMPRPSPSRDAPCLNSAHSASRSQMTLRLV